MLLRSMLTAALIASAAPAVACDGTMPPLSARAEPTVAYKVFYVSAAEVTRTCGRAEFAACSYPDPTKPRWIVLIDKGLSNEERGCSLIYEKAHMPPNSWGDASVESAEAMQALGLRSY